MPPFGFGSVASSCPQVGKRKNLSRYHKAGSRLRSLIKVQLTRRREDAQKLKALYVVDSQRVVLHPAARWVTTLQ